MAKKANDNGNIEVTLEDVRLSHPHLFEPRAFQRDKTSKPRFTAAFILDKKKHADLIDAVWDAIDAAMVAKWGKKIKIKDDNLCFIDGDDTDKDEYQGCMVLKAAAPENKPPVVIGRNKRPLTAKSGKPYGGCFVNAIVRVYAYDSYQDQVNASLEAVQFFREGDAFGPAPVDYDSHFKDYGDDDEEERPARSSRRSRDDDEEERPARSSRRSRDADEDEPTARSRARGRDDEEDDRPARGRSRDDDDGGSRRRRSRDDD